MDWRVAEAARRGAAASADLVAGGDPVEAADTFEREAARLRSGCGRISSDDRHEALDLLVERVSRHLQDAGMPGIAART